MVQGSIMLTLYINRMGIYISMISANGAGMIPMEHGLLTAARFHTAQLSRSDVPSQSHSREHMMVMDIQYMDCIMTMMHRQVYSDM